ncbi:nucleotidyltransferase domain-containing protein [Haloarcula sp. CBA1127]|nr:nucleotidyltransferase domain-containing protein [Haloarcula sp. CBA1127]
MFALIGTSGVPSPDSTWDVAGYHKADYYLSLPL